MTTLLPGVRQTELPKVIHFGAPPKNKALLTGDVGCLNIAFQRGESRDGRL